MSVVISLIYNENNTGPRTVPWGTPDKTEAQSDFIPFTTTLCCLKESIHFRVFPPIPYPYSLNLSSSCGGVSKAFSKSKINVSTCPTLSKILAQSFITVTNWVSQGGFGPGSFRPIFGVGRLGLSRWVDLALSHFRPNFNWVRDRGSTGAGCC